MQRHKVTWELADLLPVPTQNGGCQKTNMCHKLFCLIGQMRLLCICYPGYQKCTQGIALDLFLLYVDDGLIVHL